LSFDDIRYQVAIGNRILAELGLASGISNSVGHASMRVPDAPDRFIIKGRGYDMDVVGLMRPKDLVVCDLDGRKVEGPDGVSQCYEVKMHSCIYRDDPNVQSVVHVHPRYSILMSVLGKPMKPMSNSGARLVRKGVPVYPHSHLILTDQHGTDVAKMMSGNRAVLLKGHGAVTTGASLQESVTGMLHLEEQAMMNTLAASIMGMEHPSMTEEMLKEAESLPPYETLDHFKDSYDPKQRRDNGFWKYYSEKVAKDM
jgi:ribulose-5-phosphate 4-epimerase/fuculose-1-phosphate aldolase